MGAESVLEWRGCQYMILVNTPLRVETNDDTKLYIHIDDIAFKLCKVMLDLIYQAFCKNLGILVESWMEVVHVMTTFLNRTIGCEENFAKSRRFCNCVKFGLVPWNAQILRFFIFF